MAKLSKADLDILETIRYFHGGTRIVAVESNDSTVYYLAGNDVTQEFVEQYGGNTVANQIVEKLLAGGLIAQQTSCYTRRYSIRITEAGQKHLQKIGRN